MRQIQKEDRALYMEMVREFYRTDAVDHEIPLQHIENTFEELMGGGSYAQGFILEQDEEAAGYVLLAKTFSQEAGGLVLWIEEIYIRPKYQGKGLGGKVLDELNRVLGDDICRLRLEVEKTNVRAAQLYERQGFSRLAYEQLIKDKTF